MQQMKIFYIFKIQSTTHDNTIKYFKIHPSNVVHPFVCPTCNYAIYKIHWDKHNFNNLFMLIYNNQEN